MPVLERIQGRAMARGIKQAETVEGVQDKQSEEVKPTEVVESVESTEED